MHSGAEAIRALFKDRLQGIRGTLDGVALATPHGSEGARVKERVIFLRRELEQAGLAIMARDQGQGMCPVPERDLSEVLLPPGRDVPAAPLAVAFDLREPTAYVTHNEVHGSFSVKLW